METSKEKTTELQTEIAEETKIADEEMDFPIPKYVGSSMLLKNFQTDELLDIMVHVVWKRSNPKNSCLVDVLLNSTYKNLNDEWKNKLQRKRKGVALEMSSAKKIKYETGENKGMEKVAINRVEEVEISNPRKKHIEDDDILNLDSFFNNAKNLNLLVGEDKDE